MSFVRRNSGVSGVRSTVNPFCKVCYDAGLSIKEYTSHFVKDQPGPNGRVVCPTLLAQKCLICGVAGHTSSYCTQTIQREKERTVRSRDDVWLVPTGPLTNIALALTRAPDLARRIAGISLMGGGRLGNRTPTAEFNIWLDPDAAATVFTCGAPITMAGLDLTHEFQASPERITLVHDAHPRLGPLLAGLLRFFSGTYINRHVGFVGAAMHDVCSVLALTHPALFTTSSKHVAVDVYGNHTRGMTVIDDRKLVDRPTPNTTILETIDADAGFAAIVAAVRACP